MKVERVTALTKNIAYAVATSDIRILSPIQSAIGIEIPDADREMVSLGDALGCRRRRPTTTRSRRPRQGRRGRLRLRQSREDAAHPGRGAPGAGKSSCINALVTSILMRATPAEVRMVPVDPKRVELTAYEGIPHLITPIIAEPRPRTCSGSSARWTPATTTSRTSASATSTTSIARSRWEPAPSRRTTRRDLDLPLPADHRRRAGRPHDGRARDVEVIVRITQLARAAGIHLVLATQRPSVDVVTGLIKANVPSRLAFATSSQTDSRVILDQSGAKSPRSGRATACCRSSLEAHADPGRVRPGVRDPPAEWAT